jgi:hypothetical protein
MHGHGQEQEAGDAGASDGRRFALTHLLVPSAPAPACSFSFPLLRRVCYDASHLMNTIRLNYRRYRGLLTSLLLAVLVLSSGATSARFQTRSAEGQSAPGSIGSATTLLRQLALSVSPAQGVAGDVSKQKRNDHPSTHTGLAPNKFSAPAAIRCRRLVTADQPVLYLSFRASRPGGRAPPVSA